MNSLISMFQVALIQPDTLWTTLYLHFRFCIQVASLDKPQSDYMYCLQAMVFIVCVSVGLSTPKYVLKS